MKKIVLYNPSISSINVGDHIIAEAGLRHLRPLLQDAFQIEFSTHVPISYLYTRITKDADYKFVLGSNLLRGKMGRPFRQWDIHLLNARQIGPATLVGAGWWQYGDDLDTYSRALYRRVLAREGLHSVRDEYTAAQLRKAGVTNVINTACPTMWELTPEHCATIPEGKGRRVVTTITDYHPDPSGDREMLSWLTQNYEETAVWLQGYGDATYLREIAGDLSGLRLISPTLAAYDRELDIDGTDFVGTRLHAGIRALQKKRRTLILSIDNRAAEMNRDFGLPVAPRGELGAVSERVLSPFSTSIRIPQDAIHAWKSSVGLS